MPTHNSHRSNHLRPPDLLALAKLAWAELPLLAAIDLLITLASGVVMVVAVTVAPLAPLAAAGLVGPVWLGGTAVCLRLLAGEAVGGRDLLAAVRRHAGTGIGLAMVPGVVAALLLGTLAIKSAGNWLVAPLAADALVLVVLAFGCVTVFPLALLTELRGRARWSAAVALAGRHLIASAGLLALGVLLALSFRVAGAVITLALAGPCCLLVTATVAHGMLGLPAGFSHEEGAD